LIKYDKDAAYTVRGEIYIPSGDEQDRFFKQKSIRSTDMMNKPKNMYRWGIVEHSVILDKGTKVYYSQYDAEEFEDNGQTYNVVLNDHLLAYDS